MRRACKPMKAFAHPASLCMAGFIVTPAEAEHLGLGKRMDSSKHIRDYRNGRDLTSRPRGVMVIDLLASR